MKHRQSFFQKWTRWACHFKENSKLFVANDKIQTIKLKILGFLENLNLPVWALFMVSLISQYLDFSDKTGSNTNKSEFLTLFKDMWTNTLQMTMYKIIKSCTDKKIHSVCTTDQWALI